MANPSIEIAWGGDNWKRCERRAVRPLVESAVALTSDAADFLDLSFSFPKTCSSWRVARWEDYTGECINAELFHVNVPVDQIKHRRKLGSRLAKLTVVVLHELTHAVRLEHVKGNDLVELAATEGLAHVSGDLLTDVLLKQGEGQYARRYLERRPFGEHDFLKSEFTRLADLEKRELIDKDAVFEIYKDWFDSDGYGVPMAYRFAIGEVNRRLDEGNQFADLMDWPADQLLDLHRIAA